MNADSTFSSWTLWHDRRKMQSLVGRMSAVFFFFAVLALLDGLQSLVRTDTQEIRLLAGETDGVSGPCPFQNPVASDLEVSFQPVDAPLRFVLDGFFAGYLLGNGMWRGNVIAARDAETQDCLLRVGFRGISEGQRFPIHIYSTAWEMRMASPSFVLRFVGLEPFLLAAFLGGVGFSIGLISFRLGRKNLDLLSKLGHAEVFRTTPPGKDPMLLWCSANGEASLHKGMELTVISTKGKELGRAQIVSIEKNVLCLTMAYDAAVRCGCLVGVRQK